MRREQERYLDGEERLPGAEDQDARQRQLARMGNAASGAGLSELMNGNTGSAGEWFAKAVDRYRESFELAPPDSWGRPIAIVKARLLADDWSSRGNGCTLDARPGRGGGDFADRADTQRPWRYSCSARDEDALVLADMLRTRDDFPAAVGDALAFIAAGDPVGYSDAVETVLESFETREDYLEDLPVADTVIVLQRLAGRRNMAAELSSPLLPNPCSPAGARIP